jgi:hypothetical protein
MKRSCPLRRKRRKSSAVQRIAGRALAPAVRGIIETARGQCSLRDKEAVLRGLGAMVGGDGIREIEGTPPRAKKSRVVASYVARGERPTVIIDHVSGTVSTETPAQWVKRNGKRYGIAS